MSKMQGSLQNRLLERTESPKPEVGMGATELCYSDRHAWEVTKVIDDRHIEVRRMKAECIDYFAGKWEVSSNPDGITAILFLTKDGSWREKIDRGLYSHFVLGYAREYQDPSF